MQVQCTNCGQTINRKPSHVAKSPNNFCSHACRANYLATRVTVRCAQCEKEFQRPPSGVGERNFCSDDCRYRYQTGRNKIVGKAGNGAYVAIVCDQCGVSFQRKQNRIRERNFCSPACSNAHKTKLVTIPCDQCGKMHGRKPSEIRDRNFCSLSCMGDYHSAHDTGESSPSWKGGPVTHTCEQCGCTYAVMAAISARSRFCSYGCYGKWQSENKIGENNHHWKGGTPSGEYYGPNWPALSKIVRKRDNYTCQRCGKQQVDRRHPFHVHHIVYLRSFTRDQIDQANDLSNLTTLCQPCHRSVHNGAPLELPGSD